MKHKVMEKIQKQIKRVDLDRFIEQGKFFVRGEYRSTPVAGDVPYFDKVGGQRKVFRQIKHCVECGNDSFTCTEEVPADFNSATYEPPFAKGTKIIVVFRGATVKRGETTLSACTLYPYEG